MISISHEMIIISREIINISREMISISREMISISSEMISISREMISIPQKLSVFSVKLSVFPAKWSPRNGKYFQRNYQYFQRNGHREMISISSEMISISSTVSLRLRVCNGWWFHFFLRSVIWHWQGINSLRPRQNGRHVADDIFKCIFVNENTWIPTKISLNYVSYGLINNMAALVQTMAWRRPGDKPLSEPMMGRFGDTCMRLSATMRNQTQCISVLPSVVFIVT